MDDPRHGRAATDVPAGVARRFVEDFASSLVEAGVPRMPARVFVQLLASESGRQTAAELADQLVASPAAISGAVRYLAQVQLVRRERDPGSRRDHYVVQDDVWYEATIFKDRMLHVWIEQLDGLISSLGADSAAGRRLTISRAFFEFLVREMPLLIEQWELEKSRLRSQLS
jgi:DNA-binding transcriptional regulator GbsR (MarR family)